MEHVDLVIIGAGWHGLAMAKTYLEAAPPGSPPSIVILDEASSIGGTWAKERLYPGLKTNNVVGSYEFSDFPMIRERYNLQTGQHIPGEVVHQYLADFARHFGLDACVRFRTCVHTATLCGDGAWLLDYYFKDPRSPIDHFKGRAEGQPGQSGQMMARHLVVATGITSEPNIPAFPGIERYRGRLFHAKALHARAHELEGAGDIVVVGGHKSAWDVCYAAASSCTGTIHMIIRPSGGGPSWVWRPLPFRMTIARLSSTRIFTWFDPSPFGSSWSTVRWLIHGTAMGHLLAAGFWAALDFVAECVMGYRTRALAPLRPWTSTFWMGNSLSVHNYENDWFDLLRNGRVVIHHADIASLSDTAVQLSTGQSIKADAVVFSTGWKCCSSIHFQPDSVMAEIDIPHATGPSHKPVHQAAKDDTVGDISELVARVNKQLQATHPWSRTPPTRRVTLKTRTKDKSDTPTRSVPKMAGQTGYRLYRFLVPFESRSLERHNLAFIGMHRSIHAVIVAQAQALWITAFLQGKLAAPLQLEVVRHEAILHAEYERLRRPKESGGSGASYPDLVFDSIPYVDLLLEDLGMRTRRKRTTWADIFEQYTLRDYRNLAGEWRSGISVSK